MRTIRVNTASAKYPVHVGRDLFSHLGAQLHKLNRARKRRIFILTSAEIWGLWGKQLLKAFPAGEQPAVLFLPAGESRKRMSEVERLSTEMASAGADRSSLLVAFGGGIVGDVGGFLAGDR